MKQRLLTAGARLALLSMLAGCTSGNSAVEPPVTSVNPTKDDLTFAVGTANVTLPISGAQTTGLNTVVAYRQPNGLSAALVTTPTISGPAGFTVPAAPSAYGDAGTSHITGQSQTPAGAEQTTTFGQAGGAFSYGFLPSNSTNTDLSSGVTGYAPYPQPFYADAVPGADVDASSGAVDDYNSILGGPPTFTNVRTGTYPSGFDGYTLGIDAFAQTTLALGSYGLSLSVPTSSTTNGTIAASASLNTLATLPTYPVPAVASEDGTGGATISLAVPAGVTETVVDVADYGDTDPTTGVTTSACHPTSGGAPVYGLPYYYTVVDHTAGPAVATVTLPDGVGPISGAGVTSPTLCTGDAYVITAVGADYALAESAPGQTNPNGSIEAPNFFALGGGPQADLTISGLGGSEYGTPLTGTAQRKLVKETLRRLYATKIPHARTRSIR